MILDKVKIKITTIQTVDKAGNEDKIELVTEAVLKKIDNHFIVNYDESDITETKGSRTRLKIYKNKICMTKIGAFSSKMEFETGKNYRNIYTTPYGSFDLDFYTNNYLNNLDENGRGYIYIEYKIIFGKTGESHNKLKIEIS